MKERYDIHIKEGTENVESYPDGIIDKEKDDSYICNYHSICRMLNQYNDRLQFTIKEKDNYKEIIMLQEEKIKKLEELLMLQKMEVKINEKYKYEKL